MKPLLKKIRREVLPFQRVTMTLAAAAISPIVPKRLDPLVTAAVTRTYLAILPRRRRWVANRMAQHLSTASEADLLAAAGRYWTQRVETRWGMARGISFTGWSPVVEMSGRDHVVRSLAAGRGVILWRLSSHSAIPLNVALNHAGLAAVHLSRADHLMMTRSNRLWRATSVRAAPILRRGEVAHLAERVEIGSGGAARPTKRLITLLGENAVVTIVGDLSTGVKTHAVQVNDAEARFANGGAKLAVRTGAALHPVTVNRTGPLRYRVEVGEAIKPSAGTTDEAVISLIEQFAHILAAWVRRDPAAWPRWRAMTS